MARAAALAVAAPGAATRPVELTLSAAESELLLRICRRHRSSLAIYLRCVEEEARLIDEIISKISPPPR